MKSHTKRVGLVGARLFVAFYSICIVWGFLISDPTLNTLHLNLLKITYPGFSMSAVGFLVGLGETVIYGFLLGILFAWLCKITCVHK